MRFLQLCRQKLQVFNAVSYQYQLGAKKSQTIYRSAEYSERASRMLSAPEGGDVDALYGVCTLCGYLFIKLIIFCIV